MTSSKRVDTLICHTTMHCHSINFLYNPGHLILCCLEIVPMANAREGSMQEHDWARVIQYDKIYFKCVIHGLINLTNILMVYTIISRPSLLMWLYTQTTSLQLPGQQNTCTDLPLLLQPGQTTMVPPLSICLHGTHFVAVWETCRWSISTHVQGGVGTSHSYITSLALCQLNYHNPICWV